MAVLFEYDKTDLLVHDHDPLRTRVSDKQACVTVLKCLETILIDDIAIIIVSYMFPSQYCESSMELITRNKLGNNTSLLNAKDYDNESAFIIATPKKEFNMQSQTDCKHQTNNKQNKQESIYQLLINDLKYVLLSFSLYISFEPMIFDKSNETQLIEIDARLSKIKFDASNRMIITHENSLLFERKNIRINYKIDNNNNNNKNNKPISCIVKIDNINICLDYNSYYVFYIENSKNEETNFEFYCAQREFLNQSYEKYSKLIIPARVKHGIVTFSDRKDYYKPFEAIFLPVR